MSIDIPNSTLKKAVRKDKLSQQNKNDLLWQLEGDRKAGDRKAGYRV